MFIEKCILILSSFSVYVSVEWSVFVLRVLSELSLVLLVQESDSTKEDEGTQEKKKMREEEGRSAEGNDDGSSCIHILGLISTSLLPRLV